ncbi:hypothetical protein BJ508DRAFT_110375 [Ascobolus immersus RN42]|uniref:Uncharacterized protein n=1 Tax=Ascobolus immersus RN42 TaxID=1160509 RepID=A0A3N4HN86_ASCIM|nr:hypothetical protein BJ508DRAFT_110375 [Ascobolus immersus RN42]
MDMFTFPPFQPPERPLTDWVDYPPVFIHFPKTPRSSPYEHQKGSPLRMLKLIANAMITPHDNRPPGSLATILSSSPTHLTLELSTGLTFTLHEPIYGQARIRNLTFHQKPLSSSEYNDPTHPIQATGPTNIPFPTLPVTTPTNPSLNFHLAYTLTSPDNTTTLSLTLLNNLPLIGTTRQHKTIHIPYMDYRLPSRSIHHTRSRSSLRRCYDFAEEHRAMYGVYDNILFDVEQILWSVSMLLEFESGVVSKVEDGLVGQVCEYLFAPPEPGYPENEQYTLGVDPSSLATHRRITSRTVSYESSLFGRRIENCKLNRVFTFSMAGLGAALCEALEWYDYFVGRSMADWRWKGIPVICTCSVCVEEEVRVMRGEPRSARGRRGLRERGRGRGRGWGRGRGRGGRGRGG